MWFDAEPATSPGQMTHPCPGTPRMEGLGRSVRLCPPRQFVKKGLINRPPSVSGGSGRDPLLLEPVVV